MSFLLILGLFLIWRVFDFLILFFAPRLIPYLGFFPYKEILADFRLPEFINKLANFDGVHYLLIARQGYMQYEQAFFPLYPILIKILTPIFFGNSLAAGLFLSNFFFLSGLYILSKFLQIDSFYRSDKSVKMGIFWIIIFLFIFPTSFFFGAVYTEGLFLFLFAASLYFLKKEKYFLTAIFAFLASLTRLIGVLLVIPFAICFLLERQSHPKSNLRGWISDWHKALIIAPFLGLLAYMLYLWKTVGDPLFFLTSQPIFGAHRSTSIILLPQVYFRYLKIFFTASFNFQYFVSAFEFFVFNFVFVILILDLIENWKLKIKNYMRLGLNFFSLANILLPTFTGTLSSIPRYALFSLSFFIFLSQIKSKRIKIFITIIFFIFHVITLAFFGQGYFIG